MTCVTLVSNYSLKTESYEDPAAILANCILEQASKYAIVSTGANNVQTLKSTLQYTEHIICHLMITLSMLSCSFYVASFPAK